MCIFSVYSQKKKIMAFRKDSMDIEDWKEFAAQLLWRNIVYHKNEYSSYDVVTDDHPSWAKDLPKDQKYPRGHNPGDIVRDTGFLSYYIGPVKKLSWKELALELGLFEDILTPDGHDCKNCPQRKDCLAYFKDDQDQDRRRRNARIARY